MAPPVTAVEQSQDKQTKPASAADLKLAAKLGAELAKRVAGMKFSETRSPDAPIEYGAGQFRARNNDPLLRVRIAAPRDSSDSDFRSNYVLVNPRTNEFYAMAKSDITGATYQDGPQKLPAGFRFTSKTFSPVAMDELEAATNKAIPLPQPKENVIPGNSWGGVNGAVTTWRNPLSVFVH